MIAAIGGLAIILFCCWLAGMYVQERIERRKHQCRIREAELEIKRAELAKWYDQDYQPTHSWEERS